MKFLRLILLAAVVFSGWSLPVHAAVKHVVLVSIDGLRASAITRYQKNRMGSFHRLISEGAFTLNARTDADYTITIPNHTSMLTGRPAAGNAGHGVLINDVVDQNVHELKGTHIDSVFDVVRRHGLTSAMAASKLKFDIFSRSFPIDRVFISDKKDNLTVDFALARLVSGAQIPAFLFIHLSGPDAAGHEYGWNMKSSSKYMQEVFQMDDYLKLIMQTVERLNKAGESTVLIVTADHGGFDNNHGDNNDRRNYRIPFMVWGDGVGREKDLYDLNADIRRNPRRSRKLYAAKHQPIRNGDAANLALHLLGLECVPGSTIGCDPALKVK